MPLTSPPANGSPWPRGFADVSALIRRLKGHGGFKESCLFRVSAHFVGHSLDAGKPHC